MPSGYRPNRHSSRAGSSSGLPEGSRTNSSGPSRSAMARPLARRARPGPWPRNRTTPPSPSRCGGRTARRPATTGTRGTRGGGPIPGSRSGRSPPCRGPASRRRRACRRSRGTRVSRPAARASGCRPAHPPNRPWCSRTRACAAGVVRRCRAGRRGRGPRLGRRPDGPGHPRGLAGTRVPYARPGHAETGARDAGPYAGHRFAEGPGRGARVSRPAPRSVRRAGVRSGSRTAPRSVRAPAAPGRSGGPAPTSRRAARPATPRGPAPAAPSPRVPHR